MTKRVLVNLSDAERELLLAKVDLAAAHHLLVREAQQGARGWGVTLSEDEACEIREAVSETLLRIGFDEQYNPTEEGWLLESMIDKFFTDNVT